MNRKEKMAPSTSVIRQTESSRSYIDGNSALRRARFTSQAFFVVMTFSLWLGVGLPSIWGGALNAILLAAGAFSMYKVFTGVRVTI